MIKGCPIRVRNLVIEPVGIDTRLEGEGEGLHLETGRSRWFPPHPETDAQRVVHGGFHSLIGTAHFP